MSTDMFSASNAGPIWSILGPQIQAILAQSGGGGSAASQQDPMTLLLTQILTSLLNPAASGAGATAPATAASAAPAAPTFLDYLKSVYPGVSFTASPAGAAPGSQNTTAYTGTFTPPAGKNRASYPITVMGPAGNVPYSTSLAGGIER